MGYVHNAIPISVIILTLNEEHNIEDCIRSVRDFADQIIIVDSFSTDATLNLAKKYTPCIYQHKFVNFAQQRNWAQDHLSIKNEWVFHLDADERVSQELAFALRRKFGSMPHADGFMASRKTLYRNRWIRHGGHYPVYHLRIFKKDRGRSEERYYDQNYIVNGTTHKIHGDIINIINGNVHEWMARHRKWARLEAMEVLYNRRRILNIRLLGNPIERKNWLRYNAYYQMPIFVRVYLYFLYRFIIRCGFLDGMRGIMFHVLQGFWYRILVDIAICDAMIHKPK